MATKDLLSIRTYSKKQRKSDPNPEGILLPIEPEPSIYDEEESDSTGPEDEAKNLIEDRKFERAMKAKKAKRRKRAKSFPPAKPKRTVTAPEPKDDQPENDAVTKEKPQPPKPPKRRKKEVRGVYVGSIYVPPGMTFVPMQSGADDDYLTDAVEDY